MGVKLKPSTDVVNKIELHKDGMIVREYCPGDTVTIHWNDYVEECDGNKNECGQLVWIKGDAQFHDCPSGACGCENTRRFQRQESTVMIIKIGDNASGEISVQGLHATAYSTGKRTQKFVLALGQCGNGGGAVVCPASAADFCPIECDGQCDPTRTDLKPGACAACYSQMCGGFSTQGGMKVPMGPCHGCSFCEGVGDTTYDCRTREVWTAEKSEWCCEEMNLGCSTGGNTCKCGDVCSTNGGGSKGGFSMTVMMYCQPDGSCGMNSDMSGCRDEEEYDCRTKEIWSAEKSEWCCNEKNMGCSTDVVQGCDWVNTLKCSEACREDKCHNQDARLCVYQDGMCHNPATTGPPQTPSPTVYTPSPTMDAGGADACQDSKYHGEKKVAKVCKKLKKKTKKAKKKLKKGKKSVQKGKEVDLDALQNKIDKAVAAQKMCDDYVKDCA